MYVPHITLLITTMAENMIKKSNSEEFSFNLDIDFYIIIWILYDINLMLKNTLGWSSPILPSCQKYSFALSDIIYLIQLLSKISDTFTRKDPEKEKVSEWIANELLRLSKALWSDQVVK